MSLEQFLSLPEPVKTNIAATSDWLDRYLPGRYRGRIVRAFGLGAECYIHPRIKGRENLLRTAQKRGLRYAVLAGAGEKPTIDAQAPLTLMFSDDDVDRARDMVTPWPVGERVEVYSPSGLSGFAFGDMPILPPRLASQLLENAADNDDLASAKSRFFFSLYRDVYLRGYDSGIRVRNRGDMPPVRSFRAEEIVAAARELGIELEQPVTLESLDRLLEGNGWQPPVEMLERIGCWNIWVAEKLKRMGEWVGSEKPGLAVFYLRQRAIEQGQTQTVLDVLREHGFALHPLTDLASEELADVTAEVRGGNWGRGPFPVSGGNPGLVVVACDTRPIEPDAAMLEKFPLLDNARIQTAKQAVRDVIHARLPRSKRYNAMHSTDNAVQAWRAVRFLCPELENRIRDQLAGNFTALQLCS